MIKTFVEFRNPNWHPTNAEMSLEVNEITAWGKYVTDALAPYLDALGFDVVGVYPEDWGYEIAIAFPRASLYVNCGHYEEYPDGFLITINPSKPFIRRWFKKVDIQQEQGQLVEAVAQFLKKEADIYQIKWWDEKAFSHPSSVST